ncbi:MAG: hypothetical protein EOM70_08655 [Clostridia bacterium]|nr:hypothetical protein [Clostridia bacterium]
MKSDHPAHEVRPAQNGIRPVQPREPLTRLQHLYLGMALVVGLLILLALAWTVRQWQVKTLSSPVTSTTTQIQTNVLSQARTASRPDASLIPEAAMARGSHVIVGCTSRLLQVNPLFLGSQEERDAASLLFESLLQMGPDGQPQFELARDQVFDLDSHQLTFQLRDDHFFNDGSVLTAADVAWTYQLILSDSYDGPLKPYLAAISHVTVDAVQQVTFQLRDWVTEPDPAWFTVGILHAKSYPADLDRVFELGQDSPLPDGSGAYRLVELSDGGALLELRPGFAGEITSIEFRPIDPAAQFDLLQSGAIDITTSAWNARTQERLDSLPGYGTHVFTATSAYVLVNRTRGGGGRLDQTDLQVALLAALSRQQLDAGQNALLAELGHEPLTCPFYRGIDDASESLYLQDAQTALKPLQSLGLEIGYEPLDWPELASMALENRYDLMVIPTPANEKLPSGSVLLTGKSSIRTMVEANALPGASQDKVLFYSQRLSQLMINPHAFPLAGSSLGWTDRIENVRLSSVTD